MELKNPDIKTKIVHSQTKAAWNIIGDTLGDKYKIARIPYITSEDKVLSECERTEAYKHAEYINYCFCNSKKILIAMNEFNPEVV